MLLAFFYVLRQHRLPVSPGELLTLIEALQAGVMDDCDGPSVELFYHLARTILVKDEALYDRFDLAFSQYVSGGQIEGLSHRDLRQELPLEWLIEQVKRQLSPERMRQAPLMDWDELWRNLSQRLAEQKERHEGGSKWIGTGGTSPFGHGGYNPQGVRIGGPGQQRRAVKVWEERIFQGHDPQALLHPRSLHVALRRLRRFARQGLASELDLEATVRATAAQAGYLDVRWQAPRQNTVKVLLMMDIGGSMDDYSMQMQALFSAARSEFKHLEFFYFHNCVYERVWRTDVGGRQTGVSTAELMHTYNGDYRLVFVGDATMSPYEITHVGGSVAHHNPEPGAVWLQRLCQHYSRHVWLNPSNPTHWNFHPSVGLVARLLSQRMYPMSLQGLDAAMGSLSS